MKNPFVVEIEERYHRMVVIYAENPDEAFETAEELCNKDNIKFSAQHFAGRDCSVIGEANDADLRGYEHFNNTGASDEAPEESEEGLLRKAREVISAFIRKKYDDTADFSNESAIPVAATEYEDRDLQIQVFVDLPARKI